MDIEACTLHDSVCADHSCSVTDSLRRTYLVESLESEGTAVEVFDEYIFKIEWKRQTEPYTMPRQHFHEHYEIYYLVSGERIYLLEDRISHVHQGDLVLIPKRVIHMTTDAGTNTHERYVVYFKESFLQGTMQTPQLHELTSCLRGDAKVVRLSAAEQAFMEGLLVKLLREEERSDKHGELYKKLLLTEMLLFLDRLNIDSQSENLNTLSSVHSKAHQIARYIRENYDKPLSLASISEQFYISPWYLSRVFRQATGMRLTEYLNNVRIKEAQRLLRQTSMSVTDIAAQVGYGSHTHFGRIFKQIMGTSPLKYRKQSRKTVQG